MRQIKFRGLRTDGLGWAYGSLCPDRDGDPNIIMPLPWPPIFRFKVKPETVGQFTGLHDRNGVEVYEGDTTKYGFEVVFTKGAFMLRRDSSYIDFSFPTGVTITGTIHEQ